MQSMGVSVMNNIVTLTRNTLMVENVLSLLTVNSCGPTNFLVALFQMLNAGCLKEGIVPMLLKRDLMWRHKLKEVLKLL